MKGGTGYKFMFSLKTVTFYWKKKFYNFLYNPKCGLLCLLNYWDNIQITFMLGTTHKFIRFN